MNLCRNCELNQTFSLGFFYIYSFTYSFKCIWKTFSQLYITNRCAILRYVCADIHRLDSLLLFQHVYCRVSQKLQVIFFLNCNFQVFLLIYAQLESITTSQTVIPLNWSILRATLRPYIHNLIVHVWEGVQPNLNAIKRNEIS